MSKDWPQGTKIRVTAKGEPSNITVPRSKMLVISNISSLNCPIHSTLASDACMAKRTATAPARGALPRKPRSLFGAQKCSIGCAEGAAGESPTMIWTDYRKGIGRSWPDTLKDSSIRRRWSAMPLCPRAFFEAMSLYKVICLTELDGYDLVSRIVDLNNAENSGRRSTMSKMTVSRIAFVALIICVMLTAVATAVSSQQAAKSTNGVIDLTSESTKELLASPSLRAVGEVTRSFDADGKTESQLYSAIDKHGEMVQVTVKCTGTCVGNGCGTFGCSLSSGACTSCWCTGPTCDAECACSKTDEEVPEQGGEQ